MKTTRWIHLGVATLASAAWLACSPVQAALTLYDDFNAGLVSPTRWTVDTAGAGSVSFMGNQAILDMSTAQPGKAARIIYPTTFTLQGVGGQLRFTWDQQIVQDNINGFDSGFLLIANGTTWFDAGQIGRENDGVVGEPFLPHHFIINFHNEIGTFGAVDGGTAKHHFDLSYNGGTITMSVYAYNSLFDATPELYTTNGTLLETLTETMNISQTASLTAAFFNETQVGSDPHLIQNMRAIVSIDNVFTTVPEPAGTAAVVLGLIAGATARRRSRS